MLENRSRDIESIKKRWDEHAKRYDEWYRTFNGAIEHYVDWQLLQGYLPKNRDAEILDAAGGTGRMTLPLAKMGYSITLCDISSRMLNVARQKLLGEGVSDRVKILECDVRDLRFSDQSFDFVLCWNGTVEAAKELIRVTKRGGKVSIFLANRSRGAIDLFPKDPKLALRLVRSHINYLLDDQEKYKAVGPEEARKLFEAEGIRVIDIYAVCGWLDILCLPDEVLESKNWDEEFFTQVTEMVLELSKEPSVKGMSRHLVLYGEKI